ncbi:hypothetical protein [Salinirubrum litoreum]|uniref:Uncharacterized protein n=1 Tax=Salinirubrum litoreum TaxID=1126234 RepID=A0ABD5RAM5_9EURY|nr:hypothetical protein [Salinirubrum litoreum]
MVSRENKIILGCMLAGIVFARGVEMLTGNFDLAFGTLLTVAVLVPIGVNEYFTRRQMGS